MIWKIPFVKGACGRSSRGEAADNNSDNNAVDKTDDAAKQEYQRFIEHVRFLCTSFPITDEEALNTLIVYRDMVAREVISSLNARIVNPERYDVIGVGPGDFFPLCYIDHSGKEVDLPEEGSIEIDLTKVPCISPPWQPWRINRQYTRETDFQYDPYNHKGYWYKHIGIACIDNGLHSQYDGACYRDKAVVPLRVIDDSPLYEQMDTNGCEWIFTGGKTVRLSDIRLAKLFWLQREIMRMTRDR